VEEFSYLVFREQRDKYSLIGQYHGQPGFFVQPPCISENRCEADQIALSRPSSLNISLVPGDRLDGEQVAAWRELQQANPALGSPCFAPEFTQAVATVRDDVEVAVLQRGGETLAFLPFQRRGNTRAVPVGGIVSDYQGLICGNGFTCDPRQLLKACNLVAWNFDRLLCSQTFFAPYYKQCALSARIDLSRGYVAYVAQRRAAGTHQIKQCEYMMRRMERELGPIRFVPHSSDSDSLTQVLAWKSEQYRRTGWSDLFATQWGRALVERIHAMQTPHFAGVFSLLYAGQRLVAGHFGMRSSMVWHYWFPAYDRRFAKYSPGLILLLKMAQFSEEFGLRSIDIGTGLTFYKRRLMNASVMVAEGSLEMPSCRGFLRLARRKLRALMNK
jgi:CelD/BcsL family acetyltransferase involved in cellulose biosynthesis